ncbi:MAG TPA: amidohydrolase family protein [Reyranella sp.]|jgi:predicted TIM-barrel fold metal-dependent hydrolase
MRDICDCHMHILDKRYPLWPGAVLDPPDASIDDYAKVRERIGIARCVVAAPSIYGTDNSCTRDAIASLGIAARGTATVTTATSSADIAELNGAGFVAARFNCVQGGAWKIEDIVPIGRRVADFGWHVQIYARPSQIVEMAGLLQSVPTPIVFEHISRMRDPQGEDAGAFATISKLVERGRAWVKLSSPYLEPDTKGSRGDRFARTVSAFVEAMPERLVWASDWPHATEKDAPDTFAMFSQFCSFVGDERTLERILVENPKQLYGFK